MTSGGKSRPVFSKPASKYNIWRSLHWKAKTQLQRARVFCSTTTLSTGK